jgi:iron-sulfur cluster assembly accessory protein
MLSRARICKLITNVPFNKSHVISATGAVPRRLFSSSELDLDSSLILTKSCAKRIKSLQDKSKNEKLYLRVAVEGGGCSGFQYVFEMVDEPIEDDDRIFKREGSQVVIDETSFEVIKGSTIDYVQEMIRSSFAVMNNPQSESACGCGSSFAVKNFTSNPALD